VNVCRRAWASPFARTNAGDQAHQCAIGPFHGDGVGEKIPFLHGDGVGENIPFRALVGNLPAPLIGLVINELSRPVLLDNDAVNGNFCVRVTVAHAVAPGNEPTMRLSAIAVGNAEKLMTIGRGRGSARKGGD
jgi:hypothetical protein